MSARCLLTPSAFACLSLVGNTVFAADQGAVLPAVTVSAGANDMGDIGFATRRPAGVTKSNESAADSAQSIIVITRDCWCRPAVRRQRPIPTHAGPG